MGRIIPHTQWTSWYSDALKELGHDRKDKNIPLDVQNKAVAMRNETAAKFMDQDGGDLYRIKARTG